MFVLIRLTRRPHKTFLFQQKLSERNVKLHSTWIPLTHKKCRLVVSMASEQRTRPLKGRRTISTETVLRITVVTYRRRRIFIAVSLTFRPIVSCSVHITSSETTTYESGHMWSSFFWYMTPCSPLKANQYFLAARFTLIPRLPCSSTLKMEAKCSSE
jgi:hypothetical protein